jgi:xylulokinase
MLSRAYERFTGNQIAKLAERRPHDINTCSRISLVSSALASIFLGKFAGIDHSDGSGMNLMDIRTREWWDRGLSLTAPGLRAKLGDLVAPHAVLGTISPYFCARFGFSSACKVVAWSGDNPNSFASLGIGRGDIAISLGTSDTVRLCSIKTHIVCTIAG